MKMALMVLMGVLVAGCGGGGSSSADYCADHCAVMYYCGTAAVDEGWNTEAECVSACGQMPSYIQKAYGVCHERYGCYDGLSAEELEQWQDDVGVCMSPIICEGDPDC